jgi:DNA invertase Pin-like site-specific DNA recombinase
MVPQKTIAYIRFSSEGQKDGSSEDRQEETIRLYVERNGLKLVETFYDKGFSASKGHHLSDGKLGTVLADVDSGNYRGFALVVEKMDRFSRLGIDETQTLLRRLMKGGVELHLAASNRVVRSLNDLPTAILNDVENYGAQQHTDLMSINIRGGVKRIQDQAASTGRVMRSVVPMWLEVVGRKTIGVKVLDPGTIVPITEKVAVVREVYRLAALGVGVTNIARQLNGGLGGRSLSWLSRILNDRSVLGEHCPEGRDPIPNYFPQIITQAEFNAAREAIARKRPNGKYILGKGARHPGTNLFTGLTYDVTTGPACPLNFQRVRRHTYLMTAWRVGRKSNRLVYGDFEAAFLGFLRDLDWRSVANESNSPEVKAAQDELETVLKEIDQTQIKIAGLQKLVDEGLFSKSLFESLDALKAQAVEYQARKEKLLAAVVNARASTEAFYSPEALKEAIRSGDADLRLKLKSEIAKRVSRVDFKFDEAVLTAGGTITNETVARITFINGATKWIYFAGEKAFLYTQAGI